MCRPEGGQGQKVQRVILRRATRLACIAELASRVAGAVQSKSMEDFPISLLQKAYNDVFMSSVSCTRLLGVVLFL
jgi:hypothetical protein